MKLDKYKMPIENKVKEDWVNNIIDRKKEKQALLQFEESSQLNENLLFIAMHFLKNTIHKVGDLTKIFSIKEIAILCELLEYYEENHYIFESLIKEGIFPTSNEKGSVN